MSKPVITLDIDGVLADGRMVSWEQQRDHPEVYNTLPALIDRPTWAALTLDYAVYLVSSRSFQDALGITTRWMQSVGLTPAFAAGIIVNQNFTKPNMVRLLGSQLHVDDDPAVVKELGINAVLFENPYWPDSRAFFERFGGVLNWQQADFDIRRKVPIENL